MNKMQYQEIFSQFARTQVINHDSSVQLAGKSVFVELLGESWDVWICNATKLISGRPAASLGERKISNIINTLPSDIKVHRLNGECVFYTEDIVWLKKWLFENRKKLGLFKRRPAPKHGFQKKEVKQ